MLKRHVLPVCSVFALLLTSCAREQENFHYYYFTEDETQVLNQYLNLPELPDDYTQNIPVHLRMSGVLPRASQNEIAMLGRVLFYDKKLSKDGKISCASCHQQDAGFGDKTAVSKGVFDRSGDRNSIPLGSVTSFGSTYGDNTLSRIGFFWDNRARTAEEQAQGSMENEKEMAMTMQEVAEVVRRQPYYAPLIRKAFPGNNAPIESPQILLAIAEFVNAMGSFNSRFDQAAAQQGEGFRVESRFANFSEQEERGKSIYLNACSSCHGRTIAVPAKSHASNGLDQSPSDRGVGKVSGVPADEGTFKVPTLRNVALTAPYMHDGRFATLEQVIEHYSTGIQPHINLDAELRSFAGVPKKFNFTAQQKQDLTAFLHTLTDEQLKKDGRFSDPFIR